MRGPGRPAGREHGHSLPVTERKQVLLRLDPAVYDALARWASDELRSANAQIEFLLRRALGEAGRLPANAAPIPRRGRPPKTDREAPAADPSAGPGPSDGEAEDGTPGGPSTGGTV
ncbi:hypothetical protein ACFXKS_10270 [Streptomyces scopuliridis]|uniref:hypothetical protein n=1 Tax=Streptomyces scopuliridis TaxID=452529 RepID=UPI0036BCF424